MRKKDFVVEIPKKFKKNLIKRFSASNFKYNNHIWKNKTPCKLCKKFCINGVCYVLCPFYKFGVSIGCTYWLQNIIPISFPFNVSRNNITSVKYVNRKQLRFSLKKFKENANKYIKWV